MMKFACKKIIIKNHAIIKREIFPFVVLLNVKMTHEFLKFMKRYLIDKEDEKNFWKKYFQVLFDVFSLHWKISSK